MLPWRIVLAKDKGEKKRKKKKNVKRNGGQCRFQSSERICLVGALMYGIYLCYDEQ